MLTHFQNKYPSTLQPSNAESRLMASRHKRDGTSHPVVVRNVRKELCGRREVSGVRFRIEQDVSDKTASTMVVMFDEPATELVKCYADSLAAADEDVGLAYADDVGLPRPLANIIGTTQTLEKKNPKPIMNMVRLRVSRTGGLLQKRWLKKMPDQTMVDLEDSDEEVTCGMDDGQEDGKDSSVLDKRKKNRATMDYDSLNMDTPIPSLFNILHKSFNICSRTIINRDGKVQSYCGLKLTNIDTQASGKPLLLNNTNAGEKQKAVASTSRNPFNTSELSRSGVPITYHNLGPPSYECRSCNAQMWYEERTNKGNRAIKPAFLLCCQEGKVLLPKFKETPLPLNRLLNFQDLVTVKFKDQIRVYNGMFCFTSFGARIDHSINTGRGLYTFRINGQNYHRIGSLLLAAGFQPRYVQLYFFDTHNEVRNRMFAFLDTKTGQGVEETTVAGMITMDIVVDSKDGGLKRILELYPSYMALQYPLLFPYGEEGFHEKIHYHNNRGTRKTKRGYVSIKEYYTYVIQQRNCQGNTLLRGGRLYQQYMVDAYTTIEEQRLQWTRNNQDTLRVDLYHNLNDAFTRGDTNTEGLGK
ncbi:ATP-dependent DNA helicase PIF1 [Tanacetum coccineum]